MNIAKQNSIINGKQFLIESFKKEKAFVKSELEFSAKTICHDGVMGSVNEQILIDILRKYLPNRYKIDSGIAIDSDGKTSDQLDIVIYDRQYTPTLLDQKNHRYIPAESIYCVIEAKPTINKGYLDYAASKAESVKLLKLLKRTSCQISHAGGQYPPKIHFEILSGIISINNDYVNGFNSSPYPQLFDAAQHLSGISKIP